MGKYQEDAKLLLAYVGGKENIAAVSHCVSRMRFVLNDPAKADVAKIEALKSAKGTFTQAGQFQVIIGNTVSDFYNDFIAVSGIDGVSKDAVKSAVVFIYVYLYFSCLFMFILIYKYIIPTLMQKTRSAFKKIPLAYSKYARGIFLLHK